MLHSLKQGISDRINNIIEKLSPSLWHEKRKSRENEHRCLKREREEDESQMSSDLNAKSDLLMTPPDKKFKTAHTDCLESNKHTTSRFIWRDSNKMESKTYLKDMGSRLQQSHGAFRHEIADSAAASQLQLRKTVEPRVAIPYLGRTIFKRRSLISVSSLEDETDAVLRRESIDQQIIPTRSSELSEENNLSKAQTVVGKKDGSIFSNWNRGRRKLLTAETVIRLDERDRYRRLLEKYTSSPLMFAESDTPEENVDGKGQESFSYSLRDVHYPRFRNADSILQKFSTAVADISPSNAMLSSTAMSPEVELLRSASNSFKKQSMCLDDKAKERTFSGSDTTNISRAERHASPSATNPLGNTWTSRWRKILDEDETDRQKRIQREESKLRNLEKKRKEREAELLKKIEARKNLGKAKAETAHPPLTDEMRQLIKRAWSPGNPRECLVDAFNMPITRHDIASLADLNWLNDEVVNFYFNLLQERSKQPGNLKMHFFNSFFYPKLVKTGHAGVRRWTKKVDIFAMDIVVLPVHLGMHWCLAAIDMRKKQIAYYDSLKGNNMQCIVALRNYIIDEHKDKKKTPLDISEWTEILPKNIPEQLNGCDCGVFACKYAECLTRDSSMDFSQTDMPYFRQRMVCEILTKKLLR